ncbi:hypothetical protein BCR34DRAFT_151412 [Clohesyomyces aquaticus]|uniref:Uncharacterized protein n=1 Tax=Clohesyomyces aquaticus TaxID=1231657 RepID=A0A1Y1YK50_9PLEO|nr:hypothetical protein BCR34DRAFT_151412 [Clohesyomyces aquaticus]
MLVPWNLKSRGRSSYPTSRFTCDGRLPATMAVLRVVVPFAVIRASISTSGEGKAITHPADEGADSWQKFARQCTDTTLNAWEERSGHKGTGWRLSKQLTTQGLAKADGAGERRGEAPPKATWLFKLDGMSPVVVKMSVVASFLCLDPGRGGCQGLWRHLERLVAVRQIRFLVLARAGFLSRTSGLPTGLEDSGNVST